MLKLPPEQRELGSTEHQDENDQITRVACTEARVHGVQERLFPSYTNGEPIRLSITSKLKWKLLNCFSPTTSCIYDGFPKWYNSSHATPERYNPTNLWGSFPRNFHECILTIDNSHIKHNMPGSIRPFLWIFLLTQMGLKNRAVALFKIRSLNLCLVSYG